MAIGIVDSANVVGVGVTGVEGLPCWFASNTFPLFRRHWAHCRLANGR